MHDAAHPVLVHGVFEQGAVEDGAADERHALGHEGAPTGGQVVEHDGVDALFAERAHDMRSDVSRASGDQPAHLVLPPPEPPAS
ncbi:hypothetical protein GCM10025870_07950 [Agromyces marinus]|uniref:Uncharacterized protein n=1 Tax=Agromyces marinus TaxID=1389020 RepID=A0ABM8GZ41_9MICO|nr:hypothetical protein GCM10025870_07950 [Agromyces marinus]